MYESQIVEQTSSLSSSGIIIHLSVHVFDRLQQRFCLCCFFFVVTNLVHVEAGVAPGFLARTALYLDEGCLQGCTVGTLECHLVFLHVARLAALAVRFENVTSECRLHGGSAHTSTSGHSVLLQGDTFAVLRCCLLQCLFAVFLHVAHVWNVLGRYTFRTTFVFACFCFVTLWTGWAHGCVNLYLGCFTLRQTWVSDKLARQFLAPFFPCLTSTIVFSFVVTSWAN